MSILSSALCIACTLAGRSLTAQSANAELTAEGVRRMVATHFPGVLSGDSAFDRVILVVDARGNYQKGVAGRMTPSELAREDGFERAQSDTSWLRCVGDDSAASAGFAAPRPLCLVDGERADRFDVFQLLAMHTLDVVDSAAATIRFGPAASAGAVLVTTDSATMTRLTSIGYDAARIDYVMQLRQKAGVMGPRSTYVSVLYLK